MLFRSRGACPGGASGEAVGEEEKGAGKEKESAGEEGRSSQDEAEAAPLRRMSESFTIRRAELADVPIIARHRAQMFRDMGEVEDAQYAALVEATRRLVTRMIPAGEYVAWLAAPAGRAEVVAGAGVQLRTLLPRPIAGRGAIREGPEAIVLNVYTEPAWRRDRKSTRLNSSH